MESTVFKDRQILPLLARTTVGDTVSNTINDGSSSTASAHFILRVTAIGAAPSIVFNLEGGSTDSSGTTTWYTLLTGVAVIATGTSVYRIGPGTTAVANGAVGDFMPPVWRVRINAANTDSITYSVTAHMR